LVYKNYFLILIHPSILPQHKKLPKSSSLHRQRSNLVYFYFIIYFLLLCSTILIYLFPIPSNSSASVDSENSCLTPSLLGSFRESSPHIRHRLFFFQISSPIFHPLSSSCFVPLLPFSLMHSIACPYLHSSPIHFARDGNLSLTRGHYPLPSSLLLPTLIPLVLLSLFHLPCSYDHLWPI